MTVWVDADSCPKAVREIIARAAAKRRIRTVFVANREIPVASSRFIESIVVEQTADRADAEIVALAGPADLVITHDIPLAAQLVNNGITAIDDRGATFTPDNVGERLSMRNLMYELRERGVQAERTRPATQKDIARFANAFDREATRLLKSEEVE